MIRTTLLAGIGLLSVALAVTVKIEEQRLSVERGRAAVAALRAENVAAERDSTRDVARENSKIAALLGDSLRLVERRVVQVAQRSDALDQALGRERRARYTIDVGVDTARAVAFAPAVTDSAKRAHFDVRQPPYTVAADVEIPDQPDTARLSVRVAVDPIPVEARLTCSSPNEHGIRSATVVAPAPAWATVRFDRVEQSPELCASPALMRVARSSRLFGFPSLVVGGGVVMSSSGNGSWGLFVGIGTKFWG